MKTFAMKNIIPFLLFVTTAACGQPELSLVNKESGLRLIVLDKKFPLLKILIPGQATDERGIEVELPEHVTGGEWDVVVENGDN